MKNKRVISLLLTYLFLFPAQLFAGNCDESFGSYQEESLYFYGKEIKYKVVPLDFKGRNYKQKKFFRKDELPSKTAVYIVINPPHHVSIYNQGEIYESNIDITYSSFMGLKGTLKEKKRSFVAEGFLVGLDDGTGEFSKGLKKYVAEHGIPYGMSCADTVCRLLSDYSSIKIDGKKLKTIFITTLIKKLLHAQDNNLGLSIETFKMTDSSLLSAYKSLQNEEIVFMFGILLKPVILFLLAGAIGLGVYAVSSN